MASSNLVRTGRSIYTPRDVTLAGLKSTAYAPIHISLYNSNRGLLSHNLEMNGQTLGVQPLQRVPSLLHNSKVLYWHISNLQGGPHPNLTNAMRGPEEE